MDAGCSRFFSDVNVELPWPDITKLNPNRLNIQGTDFTIDYIQNWPGNEEFMYDCKPILVGTLFGGTKTICLHLSDRIKEFFEYFLSQNHLNNEQVLLGILLKDNPSLFNVYIRNDGTHLPFFKWISS